jgi:hypothetical protein
VTRVRTLRPAASSTGRPGKTTHDPFTWQRPNRGLALFPLDSITESVHKKITDHYCHIEAVQGPASLSEAMAPVSLSPPADRATVAKSGHRTTISLVRRRQARPRSPPHIDLRANFQVNGAFISRLRQKMPIQS